jgi:hypothetical protein
MTPVELVRCSVAGYVEGRLKVGLSTGSGSLLSETVSKVQLSEYQWYRSVSREAAKG